MGLVFYVAGPAVAAVTCALLFDKGRRMEALGFRQPFNIWLFWAWLAPTLMVAGTLAITLALSGRGYEAVGGTSIVIALLLTPLVNTPLLLGEFIVWLGFGALLPILPLYFTSQGVDLAFLGVVIAAWPIARLVGEPVFGWLADRTSRVPLMVIGLVATGVFCILPLVFVGPLAFVLLSGLVFFAWGEIYSLFPATCCDTYGTRYAAANAGLLYTAKGTAALLVPLTSVLSAARGWHDVFVAASLLNLTAAGMALLALKPLRARMAGSNPLSPHGRGLG